VVVKAQLRDDERHHPLAGNEADRVHVLRSVRAGEGHLQLAAVQGQRQGVVLLGDLRRDELQRLVGRGLELRVAGRRVAPLLAQ
jgi:hypothetical protein